MTRTICAALAFALSLPSAPVQAGMMKKLLGGAAIAGAVAYGSRLHTQKAQAERESKQAKEAVTKERLERYNAANQQRFAEVVARSRAVKLKDIPVDRWNALCGPASLYVGLGRAAPKVRFAQWVATGEKAGWFNTGLLGTELLEGMKNGDVVDAMRMQGVSAHSIAYVDFKDETARKAVRAVDEGKAVFANVDVAESYLAITESEKSMKGRHLVSVVAVQRGPEGQVTGVGVYDVNVYNGEDNLDFPVKFIPYETFVKLLHFSGKTLFGGIVISKTPVRDPAKL